MSNVVQVDAELKREKDSRGLAQDVDDGKAQAKYADGVLTLELPKKTTEQAKKLAIQ